MAQRNLLQELAKSLGSDPKKTGSLAVLALMLTILMVRQFAGKKAEPSSAGAATVGNKLDTAASPRNSALRLTTPGADALAKWADAPAGPLTRNLFAVRMDYFPQDGSRTTQNDPNDQDFWSKLEKSMSLQTDERQRRENMVAGFKADAQKLSLQSTVPGATPRAMIDGELVAEGNVVANFRVVKIEARRVIIEREGIMLEIQMK